MRIFAERLDTAESEPLVSDTRANGFTASRQVADGLNILCIEAKALIGDVQFGLVRRFHDKPNLDLPMLFFAMSIVGILQQFDKGSVVVLRRENLIYIMHRLENARIAFHG